MPSNSSEGYISRTHACYTGATDAAVTLQTVVGTTIIPLAIIPTRPLMLARVTRVGWSMVGTAGNYIVRLVELVSATGGIVLPANRRITTTVAGTIFHRGAAVVPVLAAGPQIWAAWSATARPSRTPGEQAAVLENPVELAPGRGMGIEIETTLTGDGVISAYMDWEEFQ